MLSKLVPTVVAIGAMAFVTAARADDSYYCMPIDQLTITEGQRPKERSQSDWRHWQRHAAMRPYAVLDGKGEVYVNGGDFNNGPFYPPRPSTDSVARVDDRDSILIRTPQAGDVTGRL